jgi:uncharacterized coiled-coil DUF342 family protein
MRMILAVLSCAVFVALSAFGCSRYYESEGHKGHGRDMSSAHGAPSVEAVVPRVKKLIEETVKDPSRAQQVEGILQDLITEVKKTNEETRGFHEQLNALNADYDAKREQFEKIVSQLNNTRSERAQKIIDMRFKIRDLLTAEEWKDLNEKMLRLRTRHEG